MLPNQGAKGPGGDVSLSRKLRRQVAAEFAALPGLREDGAGDEAWDSAPRMEGFGKN